MTPPPAVFSTGTTPRSQWLRLTSSKTAAMWVRGSYSTLCPNLSMAAVWLKLPAGPKYPIRSRFSRANEPLIISRQIALIVLSGSGPWLAWTT